MIVSKLVKHYLSTLVHLFVIALSISNVYIYTKPRNSSKYQRKNHYDDHGNYL